MQGYDQVGQSNEWGDDYVVQSNDRGYDHVVEGYDHVVLADSVHVFIAQSEQTRR